MTLQWSRAGARLYTRSNQERIPEVDYLAIVAHSDDAEILAAMAIALSWLKPVKKFGVIVVNDGVGRPRAPAYERFSDEEMCDVRIDEQFAAARAGGYEFALCLAHPSCSMSGRFNQTVIDELSALLDQTGAAQIYTHNPWDIHPSHISVLQHYLAAQGRTGHQPAQLFGGEVWGPLDQIPDPFLIRWNLSRHETRLQELLRYFASQNAIKSYDEAVMSRRKALAKLSHPHETMQATSIHLGVDMGFLLRGKMGLFEFIDHCDQMERQQRLQRFIHSPLS